MMMALKSGELANLEVPDDTYARIRKWLDRAQMSTTQPYLYCYNPLAPDTTEQRGGRRANAHHDLRRVAHAIVFRLATR